MGRLAGFRYRQVVAKLKRLGFRFDRNGPGSHEIWRHQITGNKVTVPRHAKEMPEGTLRAILIQAGIRVDEFLSS